MRGKKNNGIFNLDYEDTVLIIGRYNRIKNLLKTISHLAEALLVMIIGRGTGKDAEGLARKIKDLSSIDTDED